MRERPILFSGPMVRAILDGRKTQTRRVVTPQPLHVPVDSPVEYDESGVFLADRYGTTCIVRHRFGAPGDRLWVREAVRKIGDDWVEYVADGAMHPDANWPLERESLPSIFMPRALCRLHLEVEAVRVERLQDIHPNDALAEGCPEQFFCSPIREWFQAGWDLLNAKRGFGWATNPWVWVVTFKRLEERA